MYWNQKAKPAAQGNALDKVVGRFLFGDPAQRARAAEAQKAEVQRRFGQRLQSPTQRPIGNLPPSAKVITQYPEGISTGLGGGNAGASTAEWRPRPATVPPDTGRGETFASVGESLFPVASVSQFQHAANAAKAYQEQVDAIKAKLGGQEGLEAAANMTTAPVEGFQVPGIEAPVQLGLNDYYTAQKAVGQNRFNQENEQLGDLISQLGYDEKMKEWAMANPMLAQREYARMMARQSAQPVVAVDDTGAPVLSGVGIPENVIDYPPA